MSGNSNTSLIPSVVREFCLLWLVMLFASVPFYAAQAQMNSVTASPPHMEALAIAQAAVKTPA